jgi:HK97 family phage major capsid protein
MSKENESQPKLVEVIENIGKGFEEFKKINDERLDEEAKGNKARATELSDSLQKISAQLDDDGKQKAILEKRLGQASDRLELLEALNDRPGTSMKDRMLGEHKDLFERWVRSGGKDDSARNECDELARKAMEFKDVSIGTTTAGGFAVPEEVATLIDKILLKTSPIMQYVKNVRAGTSDYKELVSVNDAGYAWAAETTDRSSNTDTPTLRERVPTWGELYAHPRTTNWALQDLFFNVETWLTDNVAEAHAVGLSAAIWNGNGSGKPTGMTNGAPTTAADGNEVSPQRSAEIFQYVPITGTSSPITTDGIGSDDIIDLVYALNHRLRGNARFSANTTTQGHLRKLKDTTGQYLWQTSYQVGQPDRLLGYEMFNWEELGDATTLNALPLAFGDFNKAYSLVTRAEMNILVDPYTTKGYTAFFIDRRYGGIVTNNSALKFLKVSTT